jgi:hypothetical protein
MNVGYAANPAETHNNAAPTVDPLAKAPRPRNRQNRVTGLHRKPGQNRAGYTYSTDTSAARSPSAVTTSTEYDPAHTHLKESGDVGLRADEHTIARETLDRLSREVAEAELEFERRIEAASQWPIVTRAH